MSAKILIAFDDSEHAMRAVDYIARFLAKDSRVTLFSVIIDTDRKLAGRRRLLKNAAENLLW